MIVLISKTLLCAGDDSPSNLIPLCLLCHSVMPGDDRQRALDWVKDRYDIAPPTISGPYKRVGKATDNHLIYIIHQEHNV